MDSKGKKRSVANSPTDTHYEYIDSRGRSHIISSGPTRKQAKREGRLGVGVCFGLAFVAFGAVAIHLRHGSLARSRSQLDADRASQLAVLVDALRAWDNASASSDARRLEHSAFVVDAPVLKTRKVAERAFSCLLSRACLRRTPWDLRPIDAILRFAPVLGVPKSHSN